MKIFHELNASGVTVILVTHEMDVAVQAKRVIRMQMVHCRANRSRFLF